MEERVGGSGAVGGAKDKKYVLYTVVGEDRARITPGSWVIRILLGSLMIVALAVVPYVSLRLAQANSRTLVVFQPVPVHNRSIHHIGHKQAVPKARTVSLMQVADLTMENYTAHAIRPNDTNKAENGTSYSVDGFVNATTLNPITSIGVTSNNNSIMVTLHESEVTVALLQYNVTVIDSNKTYVNTNVSTTKSVALEVVTEVSTETINNLTSTDKSEDINVKIDKIPSSTTVGKVPITTVVPSSSNIVANISVAAAKSTSSTGLKATTPKPPKDDGTAKTSNVKISEVNVTTSQTSKSTSDVPKNVKVTPSTLKSKVLSHKLVYVATSASGSHVGGICVWKVDKNVTNWSYFYDNIPIEFQSGHDTGDHELRASLAAVRTWGDNWQGAHATLRSQHNAIEHSDLAVRKVLLEELEKRSGGHFTYELEWRLPEADTLVKIANSLSRLHQDYKFWFKDFKTNVDELLGQQDWKIATSANHIKIKEEAYFTDEKSETQNELIDDKVNINTISVNSTAVTTAKPKAKTASPLSHKLVYVATSSSGNHVGGFCMWKLDKNVTDWSYFYDNIPVEYQSNHDSADHEQRATLAAVRVWSHRWQDAHVTLRSQHAAIERSDSEIRKILVESLDKFSAGHFTYDLEWRLRKSDDLVKISYSLSRLHRNFAHWFAVFKASVDDVLGPQDWDTATQAKRVLLFDEHFFTEESQLQVNQSSLQSTLAEFNR